MLYTDNNWQQKTFLNRLGDLFLTATAFILAYFVRLRVSGLSSDPNYYVVLVTVLLGAFVAYDFFRFHSWRIYSRWQTVLLQVLKGVGAGLVLSLFLLYLLRISEVSRALLLLYALFAVLFLCGWRLAVLHVLSHHRAAQQGRRRLLIIGGRTRALELVHYLLSEQRTTVEVIGYLDAEGDVGNLFRETGVPFLGDFSALERILKEQAVDEVVFAMPLRRVPQVDEQILLAETLGIGVRILPDWQLQKIMYRPQVAGVRVDSFFGIPTLTMASAPTPETDLFIKEMMDRIGATVLLLLLLPFLILIALAVKLTSPGPVFFRQQRSGRNGRLFTMYKFRSMVVDAEARRDELQEANEMDGPVFKISQDPRITPVGHLLRKTSLDELPQLFNVLIGEMSLVGPRPPIPAEVAKYDLWQRRRLSMKPGLTCIWQTSGRNRIGFEEWMRMDLEYIDNWSLLLDLKILWKTVPAVLRGSGC